MGGSVIYCCVYRTAPEVQMLSPVNPSASPQASPLQKHCLGLRARAQSEAKVNISEKLSLICLSLEASAARILVVNSCGCVNKNKTKVKCTCPETVLQNIYEYKV